VVLGVMGATQPKSRVVLRTGIFLGLMRITFEWEAVAVVGIAIMAIRVVALVMAVEVLRSMHQIL
jgi:uncharacterized membrane protein (UPF0136 family)